MPKIKIPRKSTIVDMTAMCDVAFLLLSFFILATKQKPPEVLTITPPNSISAKVAPEDAIIITLTKDGRTFLMLGDDAKKAEIMEIGHFTSIFDSLYVSAKVYRKAAIISKDTCLLIV